MTVNEFMQENPAAIRPRRPAVPNSIPAHRSFIRSTPQQLGPSKDLHTISQTQFELILGPIISQFLYFRACLGILYIVNPNEIMPLSR